MDSMGWNRTGIVGYDFIDAIPGVPGRFKYFNGLLGNAHPLETADQLFGLA